MRLTVIASLLVLIGCDDLVRAQVRSVEKPDSPVVLAPERHRLDRVTLKFAEGTGVRLRGTQLVSHSGTDLRRVREVLGKRAVRRLFLRSEQDLDRERTEILTRLTPGQHPPAELNLYFSVSTRTKDDSEKLIDALNSTPTVEVAYAPVDPRAYVSFGHIRHDDIPPPTPDMTAFQGYLGPPPLGTNAVFGWRIAGGRGQNMTVCDIQGAWTAAHEDIDQLQTAPRLGSQVSHPDHGTACVGILTCGKNGFGITGYANTARLVLCGVGVGAANAVNLAAARLKAGDVMSSSWGMVLPCGQAPLEAVGQATFDAIQNAVTKGIYFVCSAGNSGKDFDAPCWNGMWDLSKRDSGALIIGASHSRTRTRASFSNHGTRIDAHAWGESIWTCGYGDVFNVPLDPRQSYTASFGGTSGAAPIVAGVIAVYVGALKEQGIALPTPAQMRAILRTHGTPVTDGSKIGRLPDLRAMLAAAGLPDRLELTGDPTLGGTASVCVWDTPGSLFAIYVSAERGRIPIGWNRPILLDLGSATLLATGTLSGDSLTLRYPIPNSPVLRGRSFFLQAVLSSRQGANLSSSVEGHLER